MEIEIIIISRLVLPIIKPKGVDVVKRQINIIIMSQKRFLGGIVIYCTLNEFISFRIIDNL